MDSQILQWFATCPNDWYGSAKSTVLTWGKGIYNQLGHSTTQKALPGEATEWTDVEQVMCGTTLYTCKLRYTTYIMHG